MSAGYDSATGNKTMTDAALQTAFPDAIVSSGPGCRCPLGSGTNNEGCETCPGCLWAPTSGLALCSNYNETNVTAAIAEADLIVLHIVRNACLIVGLLVQCCRCSRRRHSRRSFGLLSSA
eukprot:SAG31_NODE_873_length_11325_cov_34.061197_9_plen_120_part_00